MSAGFNADASQVQGLANFLTQASEVSRDTGVWFCAYGGTQVVIPGGSIVKLAVAGEDDEMQYVVDDWIGE